MIQLGRARWWGVGMLVAVGLLGMLEVAEAQGVVDQAAGTVAAG